MDVTKVRVIIGRDKYKRRDIEGSFIGGTSPAPSQKLKVEQGMNSANARANKARKQTKECELERRREGGKREPGSRYEKRQRQKGQRGYDSLSTRNRSTWGFIH